MCGAGIVYNISIKPYVTVYWKRMIFRVYYSNVQKNYYIKKKRQHRNIKCNIAKKNYRRKRPHCSLSFFVAGSSRGSDAGRLLPGAGDVNRGERRSSVGSTAGEQERERLLEGLLSGRVGVGSGTSKSVVGRDVAASCEVFGVGGSKFTPGI